jgi:hypothetical protein
VRNRRELSLLNFLHTRNHRIAHVRGLKSIDEMLGFYFARFGIARDQKTSRAK